ncbi:MAG: kelch repeat-containing protein, partial [Myxococcota bacterium]|nr:kelch repeat-containing protein [Myxococcota bacterium]
GCLPFCEDRPSHYYRPLYDDAPELGMEGEPYEIRASYGQYWRDPTRRRRQQWNWIDYLEEFGLPSGRYDVEMWFKPWSAPWFPGYGDEQGNTYTQWEPVNTATVVGGTPEAGSLPIEVGESLLPAGKQLDWGGLVVSPMQAFADLLWEHVCRIAQPCPWPDWFFFDQRGPRVGGILVSTWDASRRAFGDITGTKVVPGEVFDLVSPSIAFGYDSTGKPNRYWLFGGLDGASVASDQMWGARRATILAGVGKTYTDDEDGALQRMGGQLPGATNFFDLAPIPWRAPWPSARVGSTLVCTGLGTVAGKTCDTVCPKVDVAIAAATTSGVLREDGGALLLVGGFGCGGALDDIWAYAHPPSQAVGAPGGLMDSGWRLLGYLPGVAGGLAYASSVQVGRTLWLIGGLTSAGASSDVWRIDADTGAAETLQIEGPQPAPRLNPAVTYDPTRDRILVFGGRTASGGPGGAELWALDPRTAAWERLADVCSGPGCPPATGAESLRIDGGAVTVIADRGGSAGSEIAWVLGEGIWQSRLETLLAEGTEDCDGDTLPEDLAGARCGTGTGGFPDFARLRCDGEVLTCRQPSAPGAVLWEYAMPRLRAVIGDGHDVYALAGAHVDAYRLEENGTLLGLRRISLRRAAHDFSVVRDHLVAVDDGSLATYRIADGSLVSTVETCGRARRVFVDGNRAFVVGLRWVQLVDLTDPGSPAILASLRLIPNRRGELDVRNGCESSWLARAIDAVCDALGACGWGRRDGAAYDRGRLFLNILGQVYVLDFTGGPGPFVSRAVSTGLLRDMAVEGRFLYGNRAIRDGGVLLTTDEAGDWYVAGTHDVQRWVQGVAYAGNFAIWWGPGRLHVATRQ